MENVLRKPRWLKKNFTPGPGYEPLRSLLKLNGLNTVCREAKCPNIWECFSKKTATFLIMGNRCTRNCRFCSIGKIPETPPDPEEPGKVAKAVISMGLKHVVITSVTRDDLDDFGASVFVHVIEEIRKTSPGTAIEVLVPDFMGNKGAIQKLVNAEPDVLGHNMETVPRLYSRVRPQADYSRSLSVLAMVHRLAPAIKIKSGLMLGLGEFEDEIKQTMEDIIKTGCELLTIGQYLQPTRDQLPVYRFVNPLEFQAWRKIGLKMGYREITSGPFVRSSYHAGEMYAKAVSGN